MTTRVIRNCGECGWRERERDKHVDQLDHFCGHPTTYRSDENTRAHQRRLHIVTGEEWDLNSEQGWPEIPSFCPLVEQEPHPRLQARGFRPTCISEDGYVMYKGESHRVSISSTAAPGEMFEITMPDGETIVGVYMGEE